MNYKFAIVHNNCLVKFVNSEENFKDYIKECVNTFDQITMLDVDNECDTFKKLFDGLTLCEIIEHIHKDYSFSNSEYLIIKSSEVRHIKKQTSTISGYIYNSYVPKISIINTWNLVTCRVNPEQLVNKHNSQNNQHNQHNRSVIIDNWFNEEGSEQNTDNDNDNEISNNETNNNNNNETNGLKSKLHSLKPYFENNNLINEVSLSSSAIVDSLSYKDKKRNRVNIKKYKKRKDKWPFKNHLNTKNRFNKKNKFKNIY